MSSWEDEARNWIAWTRVDAFPLYAPQFLEEIVPPAAGLALEVGCGEGRVVRAMAARGHRVVGLDGSATLIQHARTQDDQSSYIRGDATALPFADRMFAAIVAYNSLQTMAQASDMVRAVAEASRVLTDGGHLCVCAAHPMTDAGRLTNERGDLSIAGSYFEQRRVEDTVTRDGVSLTCFGWTYTTEDYARAIEDAGLVIDRLREPEPVDVGEKGRAASDVWRRVPLFLFIRARKR